jgi:hypothetical protein
VTTGGAGAYIGYLFPYYLTSMTKGVLEAYNLPPATALVAPFNPKGGAFTLPQSFFTSKYTDVLYPSTNWPGYTTFYQYQVYNGPGKFQPNNGYTAPKRMFFPTTLGNAEGLDGSNLGTGNPLTPTTTFDGEFDESRVGSIFVEPGANRFGGTFRMFFLDDAHWEQFIFFFPPELYYGYGSYFCRQNNKYNCLPSTFVSEPGGTTQVYNGIWWLLTEDAVNTGYGRDFKATRPTTSQMWGGLTPSGNASYSRREQHYLNFIHPYTTGYAKAFNGAGVQGTGIISPHGSGYDITHDPAITQTVKKLKYTQHFNKTLEELTTTTYTQYTQVLKGVTRVVSMVRPRLTWTMNLPLDADDPITEIWAPVRLANLRVYFLPEPGGMLALGVGIASLLGLSRIRRR